VLGPTVGFPFVALGMAEYNVQANIPTTKQHDARAFVDLHRSKLRTDNIRMGKSSCREQLMYTSVFIDQPTNQRQITANLGTWDFSLSNVAHDRTVRISCEIDKPMLFVDLRRSKLRTVFEREGRSSFPEQLMLDTHLCFLIDQLSSQGFGTFSGARSNGAHDYS